MDCIQFINLMNFMFYQLKMEKLKTADFQILLLFIRTIKMCYGLQKKKNKMMQNVILQCLNTTPEKIIRFKIF